MTFKIILWTQFSLFYFLLLSSSTLGNYKSLNFFDLSFLLSFLSFFKISKRPTKTPDISPFVLFFLASAWYHNCWLSCFLFFSLSMQQATNHIIHRFLSFFFTFSSQPAVTTADLTTCPLSFLFSFDVATYKSLDSSVSFFIFHCNLFFF